MRLSELTRAKAADLKQGQSYYTVNPLHPEIINEFKVDYLFFDHFKSCKEASQEKIDAARIKYRNEIKAYLKAGRLFVKKESQEKLSKNAESSVN